MPLWTSSGCRRISAPAPLGLWRLCPSRQLPKDITMLPNWALAAFGFPVLTLPPAWVSLPHNLLYGGIDGQISSPLGWVTADNPHGSITNSNLELAGGLLHLDATIQCFNIREQTVLSQGENLSTTFWECRGSTSTNSPLAYLLCLFGMHQWFHQYMPWFDYI